MVVVMEVEVVMVLVLVIVMVDTYLGRSLSLLLAVAIRASTAKFVISVVQCLSVEEPSCHKFSTNADTKDVVPVKYRLHLSHAGQIQTDNPSIPGCPPKCLQTRRKCATAPGVYRLCCNSWTIDFFHCVPPTS